MKVGKVFWKENAKDFIQILKGFDNNDVDINYQAEQLVLLEIENSVK